MNIERVYRLTGYGRLDVDVDALPVARFAFLILFPFLSPFLSFGLASFLCGFVHRSFEHQFQLQKNFS